MSRWQENNPKRGECEKTKQERPLDKCPSIPRRSPRLHLRGERGDYDDHARERTNKSSAQTKLPTAATLIDGTGRAVKTQRASAPSANRTKSSNAAKIEQRVETLTSPGRKPVTELSAIANDSL
jgi:hypothetical protein